jgi:hypothetical protein
MRTTARLTFKQLRFESVALGVALLALAVFLGVDASRVIALDLRACQGPGPGPADCLDRLRELDGLDRQIALGQLLAAILPVFAALVLGVALIGREIERGTTTLAWTLGRSRRRWLLTRSLVVAVALLGVAMVAAAASGFAQQAETPTADLARSFDRIEIRGPLVAVRALAAFSVAVLAGALLGRTLPALLLATVAVAALSLGVDRGMDVWLRSVALPMPESTDYAADRIVDTQWQDLTTGHVLTVSQYLAVVPPAGAPPDWQDTNFSAIPIGVSGSRSGDYAAIEVALLGGTIVLGTIGTLIAVERRRPY